MNTNVDLIISGTELFNELKIDSLAAKYTPTNHKNLYNLKQFKECFGYFFRKGSAAERSFMNLQDFEAVLKSAKKLQNQQVIINLNVFQIKTAN